MGAYMEDRFACRMSTTFFAGKMKSRINTRSVPRLFVADTSMRNANHESRIQTPRRGHLRWFLATLGSLTVCTLIARAYDSRLGIAIGIQAGVAVLLASYLWLNLFARAVYEKHAWLDAARRQDDRAEDELTEVYYVELGEMGSPTGGAAPGRFHLGSSRVRAELLAAVITGVWARHGKEWTPQALDEVAAAFRADDNELAFLAAERGTEPAAEARIRVSRS